MSQKAEKPAKKVAVAEPLLPPGWGVPQVFRDRLGDEAGRQRLMEHEGHLLLVLHAPPRADESFRRGRLFWRNPEGLWKPQSLTHSTHAIGELLVEYDALTDEIDLAVDGATTARDYFASLSALGPLVRSAHNTYSVLQDARQAVKDCRKLILLRDRAYALTRRLELLQQDAKNTLDFVIAQQAEGQAQSAKHQARAAHRLNLLAALFFPLATVASVFGMGVRHGLESYDTAGPPLLFFALVGGCLAVGGALAVAIARK